MPHRRFRWYQSQHKDSEAAARAIEEANKRIAKAEENAIQSFINKTVELIKENKMGVMPLPKLLISMSLPMMMSMLVQALYNIVDSILKGLDKQVSVMGINIIDLFTSEEDINKYYNIIQFRIDTYYNIYYNIFIIIR